MNHGAEKSWLDWDCLSEFKVVKNVAGTCARELTHRGARYRGSIVNTYLGFEPRQVPSTRSQI
jgi:hypothetical protein